MSKFNTASKPAMTTNLAGEKAYVISDDNFALYTIVAANLIQDRFYQNAGTNLSNLRKAIKKADPLFVAKLAVYARKNLNLRTAPLVLMIELAKIHNGDNLVSRGLYHSICRADELSEALAYYKYANGNRNMKKLSKQVLKGVSAAFNKFDEYQFSKYKCEGKDISTKDALFIVHPKPLSSENQVLFDKIAAGTLAVVETWETKKSAAGKAASTESEKKAISKETWETMLSEKKIGYMALLRNLRNMLQDDVSDKTIDLAVSYLTNPKAVLGSKQFPFRFYTAYRELQKLEGVNVAKARKLIRAIKEAGVIALMNLGEIFAPSDRVVSVVDVSGSMGSPISGDSTVRNIEVATFHGALLQALNDNCRLAYFGDKFGFEKNLEIDPFELPTKHSELSGKYGHATNAHTLFDHLLKHNIPMDKIVVWSDMQFWNSTGWNSDKGSFMTKWKRYAAKFPNAKLILIDSHGYDKSTPVRLDGRVTHITGFSSETFRVMSNMSNGGEIVREIMAIEL